MKKIYLSATMALFLAATSCQNEEVVESVQNGREFRVEVSVGSSSRTDIGEDGTTMTWSEGDQIYVGNRNNTASGVLTLVSGAGSANAVFAGIVTGSGNLEYSVFPVPNADGVIDVTTRKAGQPNTPLISNFNPSNPGELTFEKNTCAVIRIPVSGNKGGSITINASDANLGGTTAAIYNQLTGEYELQYIRDNGGITITNLPEDGFVDVPVITKAKKADGSEDNLDENTPIEFVVVSGDKEVKFKAEVQTGAVTISDVPSIDLEESGELVAYTSVATVDEFLKLINAKDQEEVAIKLTADITIEIDANNEKYYFGTTETSKIYIDGDGHTLNFSHTNGDWNYIRCTNDEAKWFIKNVNLTNSNKNNGPWNRHNIRFYNAVELTDVNSDKAIALLNDATLTRVNIAEVLPSPSYSVWIQPNGQTVTFNGGTIDARDCNQGSGIVINDQYVEDTQSQVTLNVYGTTFKTIKHGAIMVSATSGAKINLEGINIKEVTDDTVNAVWVNSADYFNNVTVTGGSKIQKAEYFTYGK